MADSKNVFVPALDDFHRSLLESLPHAEDCRFHQLLSMREIRDPSGIDLDEAMDEARAQLDAFDGSIDAVIGFWDFPINCMVPMLCAELGLPSKSLDAVVRCEHKYWARVAEAEVVPEVTPRFQAVDPFADDVSSRIELAPPFWIKPVMSYNSYLGFRVDDDADLDHSLERIRSGIDGLARPFDRVLDRVELPEGVRGVTGRWCLVEDIIGGHQCTLEGFTADGRSQVYGIVDSWRTPGRSSFDSYRYPSALPEPVQERMRRAATSIIGALGLDHSAWNIEMFWDEDADQLWVLEVNSRLSESHCDLFAKVDGLSNQGIILDLALGNRPNPPHGEGRYRRAAKFFLRRTDDAFVRSVPDADQLAAITEAVPDSAVLVRARPGEWLHDVPFQDSYTYEVAWVHVAGDSDDELERKYEEISSRLRFEFEGEGVRTGEALEDGA